MRTSCLMRPKRWFTVQQATFVPLSMHLLEHGWAVTNQQHVLIVGHLFNTRDFDSLLKN